MTDDRRFHAGLVARWWQESDDGGPELPFFAALIRKGGGPALDAGCGAGRLLLPWLREGLDVDGVEPSADMLAACRARAEALDPPLHPTLHRQALHELDLPRRYRTAIVCGAFGIGTTRAEDRRGLERLHAHLVPGGRLAIDIELPWSDRPTWRRWGGASRPGRWRATGERPLADGSVIRAFGRPPIVDPIDASMRVETRFERWRDGRREAREVRTLGVRWYLPHELAALLELAGFTGVRMTSDYTDAPLTADSGFAVLTARR